MSFTSDLLSTLGKSSFDAEVRRTIVDHDLLDTYDDPPSRRYIGSEKKGVDLVFNDDLVVDIQIYVQPTKLYSAFSDPLPFGIQKGMTQQQVHLLLGTPLSSDQFDSQYALREQGHQLTVVYDDQGIVRYLSIGMPM